MNGELRKKYKPRQCPLSDQALAEIAEELTHKDYTLAEVTKIIRKYGFKGDPYSVLNYLDARGYLLSQDEKKTHYGMKFFYRIMTKEIYEKIEEGHRENAKRRLLAAVSY